MLPAFQTKQELLIPTTGASYTPIAIFGSYRGQIILTVPNGTTIADGNTLLGANESITMQYDANHDQAYTLLTDKVSSISSLPSYQPIWVDCKEYVITNKTNQFINMNFDIGRSYRLKKTATVIAIGLILIADNLSKIKLNG